MLHVITLAAAAFSTAPRPAPGCITEAQMREAQDAWEGAIKAVGAAWIGEMTGGIPDMDCDAALAAARGALDAAYGYEVNGKVLFKPTVTTKPDTFRNTYESALSYFVGECAGDDRVGNDKGFAFGYTALPDSLIGNKTLWLGWKEAKFHDMQFLQDGSFCHAAIAQGQLTLTSRWENRRGSPMTATVDKTFSYIPNPSGGIPLLVVHHSSLEVYETEAEAASDGLLNRIGALITGRS